MFGNKIQIKPNEFSPHAKNLGAKIWGYILDMSEQEAENFLTHGGEVTTQTYNAIKSLNNFSEEIVSSRSTNCVLMDNDLRLFAQAINKNGEHIFNHIKKIASGNKSELRNHDDNVLDAFSKICVEVFPALLLPRNSIGLNMNMPIFFNKEINLNFENAIKSDPEISRIFPNLNDNLNSSYQIFSSIGSGGSVQICNFYSLLIEKAYILMCLENKLSFDDLINSAGKILDIMRCAIREEVVKVPVVMCFEGANLKPNAQISAFNGTIEALHDGIRNAIAPQVLPSSLYDRDKGFIFKTEVDYKITLLPTHTFSSNGQWPLPLIDRDLLERISSSISFGLVMSSDDETKPIIPIKVSTLIIDPFSFGGNASWRGSEYNSPSSRDVNENELKQFEEWLEVLDMYDDSKIFTAKKRLLSALIDRLNPEDGFIDLMIALENLFSEKGEVGFTIASCVSKILSADYAERQDIFSSVKKVYNIRSNIVHGAKKLPTHNEMIELKEKALHYLMKCLKWLYLERPDLFDVKDSSERAKHIVLN